MATTVNIHEAKTHLSKLIQRAEAGEEIVLARAGKPAARLVPVASPVNEGTGKKRKIHFGFLKGRYAVPDDIKTPYAKEIEEMFFGNPDKFKDIEEYMRKKRRKQR